MKIKHSLFILCSVIMCILGFAMVPYTQVSADGVTLAYPNGATYSNVQMDTFDSGSTTNFTYEDSTITGSVVKSDPEAQSGIDKMMNLTSTANRKAMFNVVHPTGSTTNYTGNVIVQFDQCFTSNGGSFKLQSGKSDKVCGTLYIKPIAGDTTNLDVSWLASSASTIPLTKVSIGKWYTFKMEFNVNTSGVWTNIKLTIIERGAGTTIYTTSPTALLSARNYSDPANSGNYLKKLEFYPSTYVATSSLKVDNVIVMNATGNTTKLDIDGATLSSPIQAKAMDVTTHQYTAIVSDVTNGGNTVLSNNNVEWSIISGNIPLGVSINKTTGLLTIDQFATPGTFDLVVLAKLVDAPFMQAKINVQVIKPQVPVEELNRIMDEITAKLALQAYDSSDVVTTLTAKDANDKFIVSNDLVLNTQVGVVKIAWLSDTPTVISDSPDTLGQVLLMDKNAPTGVVLTATLSFVDSSVNAMTRTKTFPVNVYYSTNVHPLQKNRYDMAMLNSQTFLDGLKRITDIYVLPTIGEFGSVITWSTPIDSNLVLTSSGVIYQNTADVTASITASVTTQGLAVVTKKIDNILVVGTGFTSTYPMGATFSNIISSSFEESVESEAISKWSFSGGKIESIISNSGNKVLNVSSSAASTSTFNVKYPNTDTTQYKGAITVSFDVNILDLKEVYIKPNSDTGKVGGFLDFKQNATNSNLMDVIWSASTSSTLTLTTIQPGKWYRYKLEFSVDTDGLWSNIKLTIVDLTTKVQTYATSPSQLLSARNFSDGESTKNYFKLLQFASATSNGCNINIDNVAVYNSTGNTLMLKLDSTKIPTSNIVGNKLQLENYQFGAVVTDVTTPSALQVVNKNVVWSIKSQNELHGISIDQNTGLLTVDIFAYSGTFSFDVVASLADAPFVSVSKTVTVVKEDATPDEIINYFNEQSNVKSYNKDNTLSVIGANVSGDLVLPEPISVKSGEIIDYELQTDNADFISSTGLVTIHKEIPADSSSRAVKVTLVIKYKNTTTGVTLGTENKDYITRVPLVMQVRPEQAYRYDIVDFATIVQAINNSPRVTSNINMPMILPFGSTIKWNTSNLSIISNTGTVNRQAQDTPITITATMELGTNFTPENTMPVTVVGTGSSPKSTTSSGGGGGGGIYSLVTPLIPENNSLFTDIESVEWAKESINALAKKGVINGKTDGVFAPNDNITRAEFMKILMKALKLEDLDAVSNFVDLSKGEWYYASVATAQKLGISNGYEDKTFGINNLITREEMASMVFRSAKIVGKSFNSVNEPTVFTDETSIDSYAKEAVSVLQTSSVINGVGENMFSPKAFATRAQATKIIYSVAKEILAQ